MSNQTPIKKIPHLVIAVDGPAASGKGSLCRHLSEQLQIPRMDTGLLYRAVGALVLRDNGNPDNENDGIKAARYFLNNMHTLDIMNDPSLREHGAGGAASKVSAIPEVRRLLLEIQRNFAATPPGAILDGRDIGTIVCPDADVKFFLTATAEERTRRRAMERYGNRHDAEMHFDEIYAKVLERDARDSGRSVAPLKAAEDAIIIDTTHISKDETFALAMRAINEKIAKIHEKL